MNKFGNIAIAIVISSFLAVNFYLLFGEKSVISKSVYVSEYERMTLGDFNEEMKKEALVSPKEIFTVYTGSEDEVDSWLISEGDNVSVGDELALLKTERTDDERDLLEVEHEALLQQKADLLELIADLSSAQSGASSGSSSKVDREENVTEIDGKTTIELGLDVNFTVDVTQDGSYAQAIAAAKQQVTDIEHQLTVKEAQLAQNPSRTAMISPVEGIVSNVTRHGSNLSVDIFGSEKQVVTYAKDHEWQSIEVGDRVLLQGNGLEEVIEGEVLSVSTTPTKDNETIEAYKTLDSKKAVNPLAYYEVRISTENRIANRHHMEIT